jgi:DNA-3-methyladenine glycosylase
MDTPQKLERYFYTRDLITVSREILGKILVKKDGRAILSGKIVEVEAYDGSIDEAAHTFIGKTKRNEIMFSEGGYLYVYFTYGAHYCCNVVTGKAGKGTAILIRALEPCMGVSLMALNRYGRNPESDREKFNLTNGPGKVCRALSIDNQHYGIDLTGNKIYLLEQPEINNNQIVVSKRIGIKKSVDLPWRFYIKDNPYVSRR